MDQVPEKLYFKLHPSYVAYRTQVLISTHDSRRKAKKNKENEILDQNEEDYEYNNTMNKELIPQYTLPLQIQENVFDPEIKEKRLRNSIGFNICREKINTFYSKEKEEWIIKDLTSKSNDDFSGNFDNSDKAGVVRETFSPQTHSLLTEEEAQRLRTGPYLLYTPAEKLSIFHIFFGIFLCVFDMILHFYFYYLHGFASGYFFYHGISLFNLIIERGIGGILLVFACDFITIFLIYFSRKNAFGLTIGVCCMIFSIVNQSYLLPFDLFCIFGFLNTLALFLYLMFLRAKVSFSWFNTGVELFNV